MAEPSNRFKSETAGSLARKFNDLLTEFERDDDDDDMSSFSIKEEVVEEVMQELHKEISPSACTKPTTTWPASFASSSSSSSSSSSFSLTLFADSEGKSESCGPSVSDSASTVMAGIEFTGPALKMGSPAETGFWEGGGCNYYGTVASVGEGFGESLDGCDGGELDDEWLGRLLLWDPPPLDDQS
ncbi:hypothetical protein FH972_017955 [Carpinus fangiana]|uniref:Uncharacterized protein n=1 Tax=Carpinus fangiana TaxID=176857 RepID=A0A5N6RPE4_9ROSI|nr:hypothetical protein FH972_017955 [Carpinus fangiana]